MNKQTTLPKKKGIPTWLKIALGVIAGIIILSLLFPKSDNSGTTSPKGTTETAPTNNTIQVSASQLVQDYQANEVAADEKYKGKAIEVTGTVESISKDFTDEAYIVLNGNSDMLSNVHVYLSDKAAAAKIHKGQKLTVVGEGGGMIVGTAVIRDGNIKQ